MLQLEYPCLQCKGFTGLHAALVGVLGSLISALGAVYMLTLWTTISVQAQPPNVRYEAELRADDDIPPAMYKHRRERLRQAFSNRSLILVFAADVRNRQNSVNYEYRQNSDMLYLTGFPEAHSVLFLIPNGISIGNEIVHDVLLVQPRNPAEELWTGVTFGAERAEQLLGIKTLHFDHWQTILGEALRKTDTVVLMGLPTPSVQIPVSHDALSIDSIVRQRLTALKPNVVVRWQRKQITRQREIKDSAELRLLKKAIDITVEGHLATIKAVRAGMGEYEAEALVEGTFKRLGAEDVGYPSIVGSGGNACVLHYTKNRRRMQHGELVLMDCGAEYHGYSADITRTVPVSGKFSAEQRTLYNLVLEAQNAAIRECTPGADWRYPHSKIVEVLRRGLKTLGIIANNDEQPEQYKWYFPHGSSHCLGLDVHDSQTNTTLQPNMVITVEPGVYIPAGSPCDKRWWNIGIRIEDDILITNGEPIILSERLPRTVETIEALMQQAAPNHKQQSSVQPSTQRKR